MSLQIFIGVMVFIFGLVLGSFYNVVGYRVPNKMSIIYPNSHCPNCNHELNFYELIPVISYIFLKGKCLKCKKRISLFYPFFEVLTAVTFLLTYLKFGISIKFFISIIFISVLIIISISDLKYFIIPDEVLIIGVILMIIVQVINVIFFNGNILNDIIYKIVNGIFSFLFLYIFKLIADKMFKKESLGGGDIKLLGFIGFGIGFDLSIVTLFLSAFLALPFSVIQLIKKDDNVIPFGPYLSLASVIILLTSIDLNTIFTFFAEH